LRCRLHLYGLSGGRHLQCQIGGRILVHVDPYTPGGIERNQIPSTMVGGRLEMKSIREDYFHFSWPARVAAGVQVQLLAVRPVRVRVPHQHRRNTAQNNVSVLGLCFSAFALQIGKPIRT
jgi:hypothetical protein